MQLQMALVPSLFLKRNSTLIKEATLILSGSCLVAVLAQVSFPLPFTPVPVTGQTFGVALLSLLWGRKRASLSFLLYLSEGMVGFPVFAMGRSGLGLTPTTGYLIGMLFSTQVIGYFSDKGATRSFPLAVSACFFGSVVIFAFGTFGLSFFIPKETLLATGVLPFLPGDFFKTLCAASFACTLHRKLGKT